MKTIDQADFRKESGALAFVSVFPTIITAGVMYAAGSLRNVEHPDLEMTTGLVAVASYVFWYLVLSKLDNSLKIRR